MNRLDDVIEKGVLFLLVFTPLAAGTVQPWSIAVMEIASLVLFAALVAGKLSLPAEENRAPAGWTLVFPLALIAIVLVQTLPLPQGLLALVSPKTASFYRAYLDDSGAAWRTVSLYPAATSEGLRMLLAYGLVFLVIAGHYDSREKIGGLLRAVTFMGCFLAAFAVLQKVFWNGRLFWIFPLREGLAPAGPYINRNHFAGYMEMAVPVGLGLYLYAVSRIASALPPGASFLKRLISRLDTERLTSASYALVAVVVLAGGLFMTLSRGAITGFAASLLVFMLLTRSRRTLRKKKGPMILVGVILVVAVVAAGWSMVEDRFEYAVRRGDARQDVWRDAGAMVRDFPVLGTGLGTFARVFPAYQTKHPLLLFEHAENDYLELLIETGLAGFAAFLAAAGVFLYALYRRWRERHNAFVVCAGVGGMASFAAMAVHSFTDFNMRVPANALLMTIIAAATYAAVFNIPRRERTHAAGEEKAET